MLKLRAEKSLEKQAVATSIEQALRLIYDAFDERILPVDRAVAESWATMLAAKEKDATDIGIAATARVHGLVLVTRNTRDFEHRGIPLLNPYKDPAEQLNA